MLRLCVEPLVMLIQAITGKDNRWADLEMNGIDSKTEDAASLAAKKWGAYSAPQTEATEAIRKQLEVSCCF